MFNNILLTVDLMHQAEQAKALEAAKAYAQSGTTLYVLSVIPPIEGGKFIQSFLPENYDQALIETGKDELKAFTSKHLSDITNIKHLVVHGKVYEKIQEIADKLAIDLIITMASTQKDKQSSQFGPNVARVVRHANCAVLVLR